MQDKKLIDWCIGLYNITVLTGKRVYSPISDMITTKKFGDVEFRVKDETPNVVEIRTKGDSMDTWKPVCSFRRCELDFIASYAGSISERVDPYADMDMSHVNEGKYNVTVEKLTQRNDVNVVSRYGSLVLQYCFASGDKTPPGRVWRVRATGSLVYLPFDKSAVVYFPHGLASLQYYSLPSGVFDTVPSSDDPVTDYVLKYLHKTGSDATAETAIAKLVEVLNENDEMFRDFIHFVEREFEES